MKVRLLVSFLVILCSCTHKSKPVSAARWYGTVKSFILAESNLPADSTVVEKYEDGKVHKVRALHHNRPTVEKWYTPEGRQVVQINYSRDGQFELREEICKSGKPGFEGIFYKKEPYGLSTWWRCDNSTKQNEGVRYRDRNIGVWKTWDENGKETDVDYKNEQLSDSLLLIYGIDD